MSEIILSIITVCFNSERTIERTLKSVVPQLTTEIEYVVIDGGSTDGTMKLIHKYVPVSGNIVVSEPDKGIYDAMNKAISRAHGKYLLFINSDDVLNEGAIIKVLSLLKEEKEYGCICSDVNMMRVLDDKEYFRTWKVSDIKDISAGIISSHQGMYMSRNVLSKLGGFDTDFKIVADWDMLIRIYLNNYEIKVFHEITSKMYEGGASFRRQVMEKHRVRKKNGLYKFIDGYMLKDFYKKIRGDIGSLVIGEEKKFRRTTLKNYDLVK